MVDAFAEVKKRTSPSIGRSRPDNARISVGLASAVSARTATSSPSGNFEIGPPHHGCSAVAGGQRAYLSINGLPQQSRRVVCGRAPLARRRPSRPPSTAGSAATWAGVPSAIMAPASSTIHMVGDAHHQIHIVLDQYHGLCPRQPGLRNSAPIPAVSSAFKPGGRLVERRTPGRSASARAISTSRLSTCCERPGGPSSAPDSRRRRAGFRRVGLVARACRGEERRRRRAFPAAARSHIVDDSTSTRTAVLV